MLADVFENFHIMSLQICKLETARFLNPPGLAWQGALKKTKIKWNLLTNTDILLLVKKSMRGVIGHAIYLYVKSNNKYMKDYDKNE